MIRVPEHESYILVGAIIRMYKGGKMGRKPIEFDKDQIAQVEALASVLSVEQIADYFGIGKTTFYELMQRQPEISERYKKGKTKAIGNVAQRLLQQAQEGNLTAIIFYLKTQAGWKETQQVDNVLINGTDDQTIKIEFVDNDNQSSKQV